MSILDIAAKDLVQLLRNRMTFLFFLIMPVAFTFMFGFAFSGANGGTEDPRLPVGFLNQDGSPLSLELEHLLASSSVVRLENDPEQTPADLEAQVGAGDQAAALMIPAGYGDALQAGSPMSLIVYADSADTAGLSARTEIQTAASRLAYSVSAARVAAPGDETALRAALDAWQNPPVRLVVQSPNAPQAAEPEESTGLMNSFGHSSPAMMLQFGIAGLLTCAQVIVNERKSRCMERMLTTSVSRTQILLGHYLAILALILAQFTLLILFGQFVLKLNYFSQPLAVLLVTLTAALCISAMGLLIGILARSDEQAIIFSLIPMFVFSALGGAWVPLDVTGETFQAIGHITPVAWAMDGFEGILLRGLALEGVLLPAAALVGYAVLFFALAGWRFKAAS